MNKYWREIVLSTYTIISLSLSIHLLLNLCLSVYLSVSTTLLVDRYGGGGVTNLTAHAHRHYSKDGRDHLYIYLG